MILSFSFSSCRSTDKTTKNQRQTQDPSFAIVEAYQCVEFYNVKKSVESLKREMTKDNPEAKITDKCTNKGKLTCYGMNGDKSLSSSNEKDQSVYNKDIKMNLFIYMDIPETEMDESDLEDFRSMCKNNGGRFEVSK